MAELPLQTGPLMCPCDKVPFKSKILLGFIEEGPRRKTVSCTIWEEVKEKCFFFLATHWHLVIKDYAVFECSRIWLNAKATILLFFFFPDFFIISIFVFQDHKLNLTIQWTLDLNVTFVPMSSFIVKDQKGSKDYFNPFCISRLPCISNQ